MNTSRLVSHRAGVLLLMLSVVCAQPVRLQTPPKKKPACREQVTFVPTRAPGVRMLDKDSVLVCRLKDRLNSKLEKNQSKKNQSEKNPRLNQRVEAYVSKAITDERGVLLVPRNSLVIGQIDRVHPARAGKPAMLEIGFNTLRRCIYRNEYVPDKNLKDDCYYDQVQLNGVMVPLNQENCDDLNDDGNVEGRRHGAKNTLKFVTAGAGGGAILAGFGIGALTATGIGAGLGAGLGLILARTTRGKEVYLEAGTLFGVQLTHPLPLRFLEQELTYPKPLAPRPRPNPKPRPTPPAGPKVKFVPEAQRVRETLPLLIAAHTDYLSAQDYEPRASRFLDALNRLREPLAAYFAAANSAQQRDAVRQLYLRAESVNGAINIDRRVNNDRISDKSFARWQRIEADIQTLANIYQAEF